MGSEIVLGDRPIEITLERAWEALPWSRRAQLCWELALAGLTRPSDRKVNLEESTPGHHVPFLIPASLPLLQSVLTEELLESMKQDDVISSFFKELSARFASLMVLECHPYSTTPQ